MFTKEVEEIVKNPDLVSEKPEFTSHLFLFLKLCARITYGKNSLVAQTVKDVPAIWETRVQSLE